MAARFPHASAENDPGECVCQSDHASLGRPNTPVAILVSLSVLKEMFDLTDEALMASFRFDLRYHYALGVTPEETGMALRTLEYFRARVVGSEAVGTTFKEVTDRIIEVRNYSPPPAHIPARDGFESLFLHDQGRMKSGHFPWNMSVNARVAETSFFRQGYNTFLVAFADNAQ